MKRGTTIQSSYDRYDRPCVRIGKKRGKLTLDEIEEILRYEDCQRWNGHYAILLNCSESTIGGNCWPGMPEDDRGDAVDLYEIADAGECPVCSAVFPPFEYCPSCGTKWSDMDVNIEVKLESMRSEAERCICNPESSYAARTAWYWTHLGALDLARQLGLITEERRQQLYDEFKPLKPREEVSV